MAIYQGRKLISGTPNFTEIETQLNNKVDKIQGKGLSTNDFTNEDKSKLDNLKQGTIVTVGGVSQETWNADTKANKSDIPTKTSQLENDSNFISTIPQATTELGGIRANPKTELDTTEVKIDTNTGYLYCSGGSGGGGNLDGKQDKPTTNNTAYGLNSLNSLTTGEMNTAIGSEVLTKLSTGVINVGLGYKVMENSQGVANIGIGHLVMPNTSGGNNIGIGIETLNSITSGGNNIGIGGSSLRSVTTTSHNIGIGNSAMRWNKSGWYNVGIGYNALSNKVDGSENTNFSNCTGLGQETTVSGDNQVQLGNSNTTAYCYGAIQNRSDKRDKSDIKETELGLEFISRLKPRQFKWNYRDDYKGEENDGSKKRNRYHQGFIAQEVKAVMDELGIDFGGYQDHSINGGCDVLSLGYEEFIPPIVKVIQEQQQMIDKQQELIQSLEDRISKLEQK